MKRDSKKPVIISNVIAAVMICAESIGQLPSLAELEPCFSGPNGTASTTCSSNDVNFDAKVDLADMFTFAATSHPSCGPLTPARYYVIGEKKRASPSLYGSAGDFTFFNPALCDEPSGTQQSFFSAWTGIATTQTGDTRWVQGGWDKQRPAIGGLPNSTEDYVYFEIRSGPDPEDYVIQFFEATLPVGNTQKFGVVSYFLDGQWFFLVNSAFIDVQFAPGMIGLKGERAQWTFENSHWGNRNSAADGSSGCISSCTYDVNAGGSEIPVTLGASDFRITLPALTLVTPNGSGFCVRDVRVPF